MPRPGRILCNHYDEDEPRGELDVQLATELIEKAHAQGVSLVGPGGLLAGILKTVLQAALEAEMSEHLGYDARCLTGTSVPGPAAVTAPQASSPRPAGVGWGMLPSIGLMSLWHRPAMAMSTPTSSRPG